MKTKIIRLRKRPSAKPQSLELSGEGGALQPPKRAVYEKVASTNTDKLKSLLKDLQIEARGGSVTKNKTFSL